MCNFTTAVEMVADFQALRQPEMNSGLAITTLHYLFLDAGEWETAVHCAKLDLMINWTHAESGACSRLDIAAGYCSQHRDVFYDSGDLLLAVFGNEMTCDSVQHARHISDAPVVVCICY